MGRAVTRPYRDTAVIPHPEGEYRVGVSDAGWLYVSRLLPRKGRYLRVAFDPETALAICDAVVDAAETITI